MFGESDSESPRVPSPWDTLISSSPSPSPTPAPLFPSQLSTSVITAIAPSRSPSPLSNELVVLPRLVPESDDGNVEYKLQLLNPTSARFVRLVTQLKWRLLEGGGQAYYELGVADSGDLIGLPRDELEQSLDTLDMMAGEIGASVIVVKEIEIPAVLATLARRNAAASGKVLENSEHSSAASSSPDLPVSDSDADEVETLIDIDSSHSLSGTDNDDDNDDDGQVYEDMAATVILERKEVDGPIFSMDPDSESSKGEGDHSPISTYSSEGVRINVEIASVFKPRPGKKRDQPSHHSPHLSGRKGKRAKKHKHLTALDAAAAAASNDGQNSSTNGMEDATPPGSMGRAQKRRFGRDRRREEKRKALETLAAAGVGDSSVVVDVVETDGAAVEDARAPAVAEPTSAAATDSIAKKDKINGTPGQVGTLIADLDSLHVGHADSRLLSVDVPIDDDDEGGDEEDTVIFVSPRTTTTPAPFPMFPDAESHLDIDPEAIKAAAATVLSSRGGANGDLSALVGGPSNGQPNTNGSSGPETRLIVEALVVWKMPLEDAFLDFEGWIS